MEFLWILSLILESRILGNYGLKIKFTKFKNYSLFIALLIFLLEFKSTDSTLFEICHPINGLKAALAT